ncbi:MarR family transcriptional regulator [Paenibacillus sp. LHD-117]|uniref:MarR family winged helix-turn-helix transcriptional regulator n=1 Tax=Paenibacillus sp. LHD-117 TaxID=3071412 RepID=UPI0027DEFAE4|nr:MarR family transcriptional regulator [Paenibacillus sp. LHD-117]MDQ6420421.1 MarR family transcriptional regulator [Paenibacillus sp. LHD-117]
MSNNLNNELIDSWMAITNLQSHINNQLESALQDNHNLALKEFYVLYLLSQIEEKKLRLLQLQEMVGLSQSAISRLVGRLEAKNCGALKRHVCEDDRRGIYTCLTSLGEQKLQQSLMTVESVMKDTLRNDVLFKELLALSKKLQP